MQDFNALNMWPRFRHPPPRLPPAVSQFHRPFYRPAPLLSESLLLPPNMQPPPMFGHRGSTIPPRFYPPRQPMQYHNNIQYNNNQQQSNEEFWCETCDRGFWNKMILDNHMKEHQKCNIDGCQFTAHPKVITKHIQAQHSTGLYKQISKLSDPEEIKKWRDERKRKYPTKSNIDQKKAAVAERIERGEKMGLNIRRFPDNKHNMNRQDNRNSGRPIPGQKRTYNHSNHNQSQNNNNRPKRPERRKRPKILKPLESTPDPADQPGLKPFCGLDTCLLEIDTDSFSDNEEDLAIDDEEWVENIEPVKEKVMEKTVCNAISSLIANYGSSDDDQEEMNVDTSKIESELKVNKSQTWKEKLGYGSNNINSGVTNSTLVSKDTDPNPELDGSTESGIENRNLPDDDKKTCASKIVSKLQELASQICKEHEGDICSDNVSIGFESNAMASKDNSGLKPEYISESFSKNVDIQDTGTICNRNNIDIQNNDTDNDSKCPDVVNQMKFIENFSKKIAEELIKNNSDCEISDINVEFKEVDNELTNNIKSSSFKSKITVEQQGDEDSSDESGPEEVKTVTHSENDIKSDQIIPETDNTLNKIADLLAENIVFTGIKIDAGNEQFTDKDKESGDESGPEEVKTIKQELTEVMTESPREVNPIRINDTAHNLLDHKSDQKNSKSTPLISNYQNDRRQKFNYRNQVRYNRKPPSSLLEKLLASEIKHERNVTLQCIRYIVKNNYLKK